MNIAELFVRVTADTESTNRKIAELSRRLEELGGKTKKASDAHEGHSLSLGRVERALASYVGHAAGANQVTEALSTAFGGFALGGTVVTGVLLGIGAIVGIYEHLNSSSQKTREEADKLTKSLNDQADARFRASTAGLQAQVGQASANVAAAQKETGAGFFSQLLQGMAPGGQSMGALTGSDSAARVARIGQVARASQEAVNQLGLAIGKTNDETAARVAENARKVKEAADAITAAAKKAQADFLAAAQSALTVFDELASHGIKSTTVNATLISDYNKIAAQIREMGNASGPAIAGLLKLRDALASNLVVAQEIARVNSTGVVAGLAGKTLPGMSLTPNGAIGDARNQLVNGPVPNVGGVKEIVHVESAIERQTREAAEHAEILKRTFEDVISTLGSVIVSALNVGGGGRGSQIGGALGGAIGLGAGEFAGKTIGGLLGSVVPGVGTVVGAIAGSFIGGLFDHKKSVDRNTDALNKVSALLNAPSGFKVNLARFNATSGAAGGFVNYGNVYVQANDVNGMVRELRAIRSRGGPNTLAAV